MVQKKDLLRLRKMMNDFRTEVWDMPYLKRCLWNDMKEYLDALIEEEFEEELK